MKLSVPVIGCGGFIDQLSNCCLLGKNCAPSNKAINVPNTAHSKYF
jgi:hypothetical protein